MTDFECHGGSVELSCHSHGSNYTSLHCHLSSHSHSDAGDGDDHGHSHSDGDTHGHSHGYCNPIEGSFSLGIHVAAIFIILAASAVGAALPLLGRRVRALRIPAYVYALGKACSVGVMAAVAMIHMIHHASEALSADCVPESFTGRYESWYMLFALLAAVFMHFVDTTVLMTAETLRARSGAERACDDTADTLRGPASGGHHHHHHHARGAGDSGDHVERYAEVASATSSSAASAGGGSGLGAAAAAGGAKKPGGGGEAAAAAIQEPCCPEHDAYLLSPVPPHSPSHSDSSSSTAAAGAGAARPHSDSAMTSINAAMHRGPHTHGHSHSSESHGHSHAVLIRPGEDQSRLPFVVAALCMEFGVTLHSVFVGLTVGITADGELTPLLIALVFHQLFEGLAMGSRLADAEFMLWLEVLLAVVFAASAPVGIAVGTGVVARNRAAFSGAAYAITIGVLDAVCGGILLYLAFNMLFVDFAADVRRYCAPGVRLRPLRLAGLLVSMWIGAGVMAILGKWV